MALRKTFIWTARYRMRNGLLLLLGAGIFAIALPAACAQEDGSTRSSWVATWATAEEMAVTDPDQPILPRNMKMPDFKRMKGVHGPPPLPDISDRQTVRMIVRTTIPGRKVRIELANAFDKGTVSVGDAHVAIRTSGSMIASKTDREVTFSGRKYVDLRAGQVAVSDPIDLAIRGGSDLAVSLYVVKTQGTPTNHNPGLHTAYLSDGDTTAAESMSAASTNTSYVWLRSVDVVAIPGSFAISCLGDSITDGFRTTVDADRAWPTLLGRRFSKPRTGVPISVLNAGISGNEVLHDGAGVSALARFDRDVSSEPGVHWVVLLEGINDINIHGQVVGPDAVTAEDLIAGYKQLIARAHVSHIKIMGATLTPEEGVWLAGPVGEATREKVNRWIKDSGSFDAMIDLDAVVRDPTDFKRLRPEFDSGDHIHPNDAGNAAIADAFHLSVFNRAQLSRTR